MHPANIPSVEAPTLSISRTSDGVSTLGPGLRAVVWVRGCPLHCAGCIAPEDFDFDGGTVLPVARLAEQFNALPPGVGGVTFSGGEPMMQASALAALLDLMRRSRDWSAMSYTGYTLEHLRRHGDPGQQALLDRLDILVDGPYLQNRHAALAWRGSSNQRLHMLSGRHQAPDPDVPAGIEFELGDGTLMWSGVPPVPGFREDLERALADNGFLLVPDESGAQ